MAGIRHQYPPAAPLTPKNNSEASNFKCHGADHVTGDHLRMNSSGKPTNFQCHGAGHVTEHGGTCARTWQDIEHLTASDREEEQFNCSEEI